MNHHQFDPQSLNKYAYARNDPIRLIDREGLAWGWVCSQWEDNQCTDGYMDPDATPDKWDPFRIVNDGDTSGGINPGPPATHAELTQIALARAKAAVADKNSECSKFLSSVIGNLGLKDKNGKTLTPAALVDLLTPKGTIKDDAPRDQTGGPAYTTGGIVNLTGAAYTSYLYATLIHEAFHLNDVNNDALLSAMKNYKPEGWGALPGAGDDRTGYVARHCGGM